MAHMKITVTTRSRRMRAAEEMPILYPIPQGSTRYIEEPRGAVTAVSYDGFGLILQAHLNLPKHVKSFVSYTKLHAHTKPPQKSPRPLAIFLDH